MSDETEFKLNMLWDSELRRLLTGSCGQKSRKEWTGEQQTSGCTAGNELLKYGQCITENGEVRAVAVCDNARHEGDKVKAGGRCVFFFFLFYILCENVFVDPPPSQSEVRNYEFPVHS